MSDNLLRFIPTDPTLVPDVAAREVALDRLRRWLPDADEVTETATDHVMFVDPGANFERVSCPSCGAELELAGWQDEMGRAAEGEFADLSMLMPCCGASVSLNDLHYEWPAGFARYVLDVRNPGVPDLADDRRAELEVLLGTPVRRIWAHY